MEEFKFYARLQIDNFQRVLSKAYDSLDSLYVYTYSS